MDIREEIHTGLTKEQAYELMEKGAMIAHEYYADDEYLYMVNGIIMDENGYHMGNSLGDFWQNRQKWKTGWMTANAR